MLIVKASIRSSPIHGLGIFADEPIVAGSAICKFVDGFDHRWNKTQLLSLPMNAMCFIWRWGFMGENADEYYLDGDDMRFINHSSTPNCDASTFAIFAMDDIAPGTELTINYALLHRVTFPENALTEIYNAFINYDPFYDDLLNGKAR